MSATDSYGQARARVGRTSRLRARRRAVAGDAAAFLAVVTAGTYLVVVVLDGVLA